MLQYNIFPNKFRQASAILNQSNLANHDVPAYLHYNSATDRRRYNLPMTEEIAVILPGDGTEVRGMRDIVLHLKGNNQLMQINECHPAYLPLHYVLLFPYGELGWEPEMKQWDVLHSRHIAARLTQSSFTAIVYLNVLQSIRLFKSG